MSFSPDGRWSSRPLTTDTWPDFERLCARYHGVQAVGGCMFYHQDRPVRGLGGEKRIENDRADRKRLVQDGRAHGVPVDEGETAIGGCPFGPREGSPEWSTDERTVRSVSPPPTSR